MLRRYSRIIAAIVVSFFTWTSGGVFSVAHAAQVVVKQERAKGQTQGKSEGAEERFSKLTDELTGVLTDSKLDVEIKKRRLLEGKAELGTLDAEIRTQFTETEKRLAAAKLPAEIMERHRKFVKHYDDNLAEFKGNLERVEKAKDKKQAEAELEKTRAHLEQVKAPSRHQKLDPNNLPFRQPKVIKREPRMKKEEFERDLKKDKNAWRSEKRIMVASTGSVTGLLPSDDLAETIEVQFTPEIKAKAQELGNNPVKIYEWVRNNIEFVPTWGSIQGAQMTLLTKQGNAFDTSSLLISLLRAAGIQARYVTGTIEVPIDKVMNWTGGFSDPTAALNFVASGGVPVTGLRSGGKVVAARMEHVWVKAWIDYIPSRGAVHKEGDTWIALDASFKKHNYTDGVNFKALVPFDGQGFAAQLKAAATVNDQEGYVTNVSSSSIQSALSDYNTRLESYVSQNLPNATAADILGKTEIVRKEQVILPASLPYKVAVNGIETAEVPASYQHSIKFEIAGAPALNEYGELITTAGLSYASALPSLAGKRVTVRFDPATPADKAIIDSYVAQQATLLPAYMIQVVPTLRVDNVIVAAGPSIGMGSEQPLEISISSLNNSQIVTHNLYAGDYAAIGLNPSKIGLDVLQNRIDKSDFSEPVGEMLHQTALSYWGEVDAFNDVIAKTIGVRNLRHPSELAATARISLSWLWGIRAYGTYKSRNIDVKLDNQSVMGKTIDSTKEFAYMQQSGANSSFLEGAVFDQLFGKNIGDSISAVTAMNLANDQGVPIYRIDASNVSTIIPKLQVSVEIKNEVANAVNAGLTVQIPKTNITQLGWTGVGYIISNPTDGTAAYRISGGLNGGDSKTVSTTVVPLPQIPITGPVGLIIGSLGSSASSAIVAESGVLIGIATTLTLGEIILIAAFLALIFLVVMQVANKLKREANWQPYRHYTQCDLLPVILLTQMILPSWDGDLGPGAYVSDYFDDPHLNGEAISNRLRIGRIVESYIDLEIDRNLIPLKSNPVSYPNQYVLQYLPLVIDHVNVKVIGADPACSSW